MRGYAARATAKAGASFARMVKVGVKAHTLDSANSQVQHRPFVLEASELALDFAPRLL